MTITKTIRNVFIVAGAACMTIAPSLSMAVQRKLRPDATDIGGYLYQLIGRTAESIELDTWVLSILFVAMLWLARRYLFHKPPQTKGGEYLLAAFLSLMMLLASAIRAGGSVQPLYENAFQLFKVCLYLWGMTLLFLCAIRGLNELLNRQWRQLKNSLWEKHPFGFPLLVLCLVWLPQIVIKYPGVLTIDTCLQFREYLQLTPRSTTHPPAGTLFYGLMIALGQTLKNYNIVFLFVMLLQVVSMLFTMSYFLRVLRRENAPQWVNWLALLLFAFSPSYIGWIVVIGKDSAYLIQCLLASVMLMDFACNARAFLKNKFLMTALPVNLTLMILTRHNGLSIAIPMLLAMAFVILANKLGLRTMARFALLGCLAIGIALGTNEAIIQGLQIKRVTLYDYLSVPFQQTARVARLHGDNVTPAERDAINRMLDYDLIAERYHPQNADFVKWTAPGGRTDQDRDIYLTVWFQQMLRYPMDYVDALLNMNIVLFDVQSNYPIFIGLSDNSLYDFVYPFSFNDMNFYNSEEIRPLNSLQMALTELYYRASELPMIGLFASMGFCVDTMLIMLYLAWVNHRRRTLITYIPSVIVMLSGLFCPVVYTRYLLTTLCSLPLWVGAYYAIPNNASSKQALAVETNVPATL